LKKLKEFPAGKNVEKKKLKKLKEFPAGKNVEKKS
jgi:hypothetical protein